MQQTRLIGALLFLVAGSVEIFFLQQMREARLRPSGVLFGTLLFVFPLVVAGLVLWARGRKEEAQSQRIELQKEILGLVKTKGKVSFSEACSSLSVTQAILEKHLRDLTAKDLFQGSIHWQERELRSHEAALVEGKCGHCGGELDLAGKGVVACEYCGNNYYLEQA